MVEPPIDAGHMARVGQDAFASAHEHDGLGSTGCEGVERFIAREEPTQGKPEAAAARLTSAGDEILGSVQSTAIGLQLVEHELDGRVRASHREDGPLRPAIGWGVKRRHGASP